MADPQTDGLEIGQLNTTLLFGPFDYSRLEVKELTMKTVVLH